MSPCDFRTSEVVKLERENGIEKMLQLWMQYDDFTENYSVLALFDFGV